MNNLSKQMQERLDAWRKNTLPVASTKKVTGNYVGRRGDYGDDIRDFERKDEEAWQKQVASDPVYRRYS